MVGILEIFEHTHEFLRCETLHVFRNILDPVCWRVHITPYRTEELIPGLICEYRRVLSKCEICVLIPVSDDRLDIILEGRNNGSIGVKLLD